MNLKSSAVIWPSRIYQNKHKNRARNSESALVASMRIYTGAKKQCLSMQQTCQFQDRGVDEKKTQNAQNCMRKSFQRNHSIHKNVEKLSDFIQEINYTTSSNHQRARTSNYNYQYHKLNNIKLKSLA